VIRLRFLQDQDLPSPNHHKNLVTGFQAKLVENLASLFESNLTFTRMLLPITEPAPWNKKIKARLMQLAANTKELVQALNDNFGSYDEQIDSHKEESHAHYLDLSKLK